jgi:hypothetical protein
MRMLPLGLVICPPIMCPAKGSASLDQPVKYLMSAPQARLWVNCNLHHFGIWPKGNLQTARRGSNPAALPDGKSGRGSFAQGPVGGLLARKQPGHIL